MRRGRHPHHHVEALTRVAARASLIAAVVLGAAMHPWALSAASDPKLTADGTLYVLETAAWTDGASTGGSYLRLVSVDSDGVEKTEVVPGTDDFYVERTPRLDLDPRTEYPIVAYIRQSPDGGTDVMIARRTPDGWDGPRAVHSDPRERSIIDLGVESKLVHVAWNVSAADNELYRLSLDRLTLSGAFGPELLPTDSDDSVSVEGGPGTDELPPDAETLRYFAAIVDAGTGSGNGRIAVWGIRDEPIPIVYFEAFDIGGKLTDPQGAGAGVIASKLAVWSSTSSRFMYSMRIDGLWSDRRIIPLDRRLGEAEAKDLIREMIERSGALPH